MENTHEVVDPDLFTVAIAIAAACSAAATIGNAIRERRRERREIRNQLYKAYRALNSAEKCLKNFASYIDQFNFLYSPFRIASTSIFGDTRTADDLKRIYMESCYAGRDLIEASSDLSNLLSDEDAAECQRKVVEFDNFFKKAMTSENYGRYIHAMTEFIIELKHLLNRIANRYDVNMM